MADPFDRLRLPPAPVAPDPAFAASLRARLETALAPEPDPVTTDPTDPTDPTEGVPALRLRGDSMATTAPSSTPAAHALTPYLAVHDAAAALEWYRDVLGAIETTRFVGDDGRVGHAEVAIGGARLLLSDAYPEIGIRSPRDQEGTSVTLHLEVVDVDHTHRRAIEAGAESLRGPADQGHGNRNATVVDPFGHRWMLSQPIDAIRTAAAEAETGVGGDGSDWKVTGRRAVEPGYLVLGTGDLERARAFFGQLFGWEVEPGHLEGGGHVANTDFPLGFMEGGGLGGTQVNVHFRVDDIDAYAARVEELGGRVLSRATYSSGGNAECVDDQGFRFALFRPAPGY